MFLKKKMHLCLLGAVCYLLFSQGRHCCCLGVAAGCRVDLVWVTLICLSEEGAANQECIPLPCLCQTIDLRDLESCPYTIDKHTLQGRPPLLSFFTVLSSVGCAAGRRHILLSFCSCLILAILPHRAPKKKKILSNIHNLQNKYEHSSDK